MNFSPVKVVKHLKKLDNEFIKYFAKRYEVDFDKLVSEATTISSRCNSVLHKYINKTLDDIRNNKELLDLCM